MPASRSATIAPIADKSLNAKMAVNDTPAPSNLCVATRPGSSVGSSPSRAMTRSGSIGIFKHVLDHGGNDTSELSLYAWIAVVIVYSLVIYYWALQTRLRPEQVDHYVREVYPPPAGEG